MGIDGQRKMMTLNRRLPSYLRAQERVLNVETVRLAAFPSQLPTTCTACLNRMQVPSLTSRPPSPDKKSYELDVYFSPRLTMGSMN